MSLFKYKHGVNLWNLTFEEFEKIPNTRSSSSDGRSYFCNECKGKLSVKQREVILARHRRKIYTDYKDRPQVNIQ